MKNRIDTTVAAAVLLSSSLCFGAGNVFYWQGGDNFRLYTDPANWSLSRETYDNPGNDIPGSGDFLYAFTSEKPTGSAYGHVLAYFDMDCGVYSLAGLSIGDVSDTADYKNYSYEISVKNGSLSFPTLARPDTSLGSDAWKGATYTWRVTEGGTLNLANTGIYIAGNVYTLERMWAHRGGVLNVNLDQLRALALHVSAQSGGTIIWAPRHLGVSNQTYGNDGGNKRIRIENEGTFIAPNGFTWDDDRYGDKKYLYVTNFTGATMVLGGPVRKTIIEDGSNWGWDFVLAGGTLVASNAVAFFDSGVVVGSKMRAIVPSNASVEINVLDNSSCDMSTFQYGSGSGLTKTGPGPLTLKGDRPATVAVDEGSMILADNVPGETVGYSGLAGFAIGSGAKLVANAATDISGSSLSPGATVAFGQPGNTASVAPTGYATAEFELADTSAFGDDSVVISSSDATFLAAVADSLNMGSTLPAGMAAVVSGGAVRFEPSNVPTFSHDGEMDLSDSSGWNTTDYAGHDVYVSGTNTVAILSASSPSFTRITVRGGATLKVSGAVTLPLISLMPQAALVVPAGATATASAAGTITTTATGTRLPVLKVETGGRLTVARGTKFKNVAVKLYGEIGVPASNADISDNNHGISFGYAAAGETTYFAMESDGGNIDVTGNTGYSYYGLDFMFAEPAAGGLSDGRVVAVGDILLKDTTFNANGNHYIGKQIGGNNPEDSGIRIVLDGTVLPIVRNCRFRSGTVVCRNGGMIKRTSRHPGNWASLVFERYAKIAFEGAGSGLVMPYSAASTPFSFSYWGSGSYWSENHNSLIFRDGAAMSVHKTAGEENANVVFSNGVYHVATLPYTDGNPNPPDGDPRNWMSEAFAGAYQVKIEAGGKLFFQSADTLEGNNDWDRYITIARPIGGAGDFVMTNGVPGCGFAATIKSANNDGTGSVSVAPHNYPTTLYFNDGAKWAGRVIAGDIALTNLTDAAAPATVSFATLDFAGDFPIRVWKNGGVWTNDIVNVTSGLAGEGAFELIYDDALESEVNRAGSGFDIGICPKAGFSTGRPRLHAPRKWMLLGRPVVGDETKVMMTLKYAPRGLAVVFQ